MRLIQHDLLVLDQVTSFMSNDFAIMDQGGTPVGQIVTQGSGVSRFFLGTRELTVLDPEGVVVSVRDTVDFGRDRYALTGMEGEPLATVVRRITLFKKRLGIELAGGGTLEVTGSFWEREFEVTDPGGVAARVSRSWSGISAALLGRERYAVGFTPGVPLRERAAILGAVVALDLIRAKQSAAAASSSAASG